MPLGRDGGLGAWPFVWQDQSPVLADAAGHHDVSPVGGSGPAPAAATAALVTDIGNDVLYGIPVDTILAWVEECLERIGRRLGFYDHHRASHGVATPCRATPLRADEDAPLSQMPDRSRQCLAGGARVERAHHCACAAARRTTRRAESCVVWLRSDSRAARSAHVRLAENFFSLAIIAVRGINFVRIASRNVAREAVVAHTEAFRTRLVRQATAPSATCSRVSRWNDDLPLLISCSIDGGRARVQKQLVFQRFSACSGIARRQLRIAVA